MLLTFRAMSIEEETTPATRENEEGCIRTMAVSQKKVEDNETLLKACENI